MSPRCPARMNGDSSCDAHIMISHATWMAGLSSQVQDEAWQVALYSSQTRTLLTLLGAWSCSDVRSELMELVLDPHS